MLDILERLWTIGITTPEPAPEAWNWSLAVDLITGLAAVGNLILIIVIWRSNKRQVERQIHGGEPILYWSWDSDSGQAKVTLINPRTYPIVFTELVVTDAPPEVILLTQGLKFDENDTLFTLDSVVEANSTYSVPLAFSAPKKEPLEFPFVSLFANYHDTLKNQLVSLEAEEEVFWTSE